MNNKLFISDRSAGGKRLPVMTVVSMLVVLFGITAPWSSLAVTVPVQEGFEGYADGTMLSALSNQGWGASADTAVIRTVTNVADAVRGTNAVFIPGGVTVTNSISSVSQTNVWVEMVLHPSMGMSPDLVGPEAVDPGMTVQAFLDTNGCPVVWSPSGSTWLVSTQDYWHTSVSTFNTSQWERLTFCQNYSNKTSAVFLNGHLMLAALPFIDTSRTSYGRLEADGGASVTSYLDEVSAAYIPPADLTADLDHDSMPDVQEIQLYGNVTTWRELAITSAAVANGGPSATGGAVTLSTNQVLPGGQVSCTLTAAIAYAVSSLKTNGVVAASYSGLPRTASYTLANIWSDITVTGVFAYTARRYVPGDYATLQAAVTAAYQGETIVVSAGFYTNDVALGGGVTLTGTNVTILGALTIGAGATGTLAGCSGLVVTGGVTVAGGCLVVSNGTVNIASLTIQSGGTVQVVNASAFVVNGVTYTGSRTFVTGWEVTLVPQTPPYADTFERYGVGAKLNQQGYAGWVASSDGVVVETGEAQSGQAVVVPPGDTITSTMTASPSTNVWVEFYYKDAIRIPIEDILTNDVDASMAVQAFINTNGYVTVFNPELSRWDVCSNDARGTAVAPLAATAWPRVTFNQNYLRGRTAVFLNGRLLRQELRFINTNLVNSGRVEVDSGTDGSTYLDTFSVRISSVGIVSDDADHDGWPDALEIDMFGNTSQSLSGSVYLLR